MRRVSATVGRTRVAYAGPKGYTVYGRTKGGAWVREAWFARQEGVMAYAGGHAGGYGLPAGPGEILGREVWEALKKAVERWNAALAKEYSR